MMKKVWLFSFLVLVLLAACGSQPAAENGEVNHVPTQEDVIGTEEPELAPVVSPTVSSSGITVTLESPDEYEQTAIQHYQIGEHIQIYKVSLKTLREGWGQGRVETMDSDHILYTNDGGNTWMDVSPPHPVGNVPLQARTTFVSKDTAYVIYFPQDQLILVEKPFVWRTNDRGQTWQGGEVLDTGGLDKFYIPDHLVFANSQDGWLSVNVGAGMSQHFTALYQTGDGGQSWIRILDPFNGTGLTCKENALVFADRDRGWAALDCQGLYSGVTMSYTTNGGGAWGSVVLPPPPDQLTLFEDSANCFTHSPHRFSLESGLVGVTCEPWENTQPATNYLYLTEDGGQTWQSKPAPEGEFYFYTWYQGYLTGPIIYSTNDRGSSWTPMSKVEWWGDFNFINSQLGWVVAHYQGATSLMSTVDGGATWTEISPVIVME